MEDFEILLSNIDKIHTTEMGIDRIKRNLRLDDIDVLEHCKELILNSTSSITKRGKNWYIYSPQFNCTITVNSHSYTIITAHKKK